MEAEEEVNSHKLQVDKINKALDICIKLNEERSAMSKAEEELVSLSSLLEQVRIRHSYHVLVDFLPNLCKQLLF